MFPVFGGLLYLLINYQSSTWQFKKKFKNIENASSNAFYLPGNCYTKAASHAPEFITNIRYLQKTAGFPIYERTKTRYLSPGEEMFRVLLKELEKAEKYIFLETFILQEGKMWNSILKILEKKSSQGIDIRLIYDDMGSFFANDSYLSELRKKGINCTIFNPFRPILTSIQNNRDHRKITVIDGKTAFTGGINFADEYINEIEKHGHWKDASVMVCGDAAWSMTVMFLQMWSFCTNTTEDYKKYYPDTMSAIESDGFVQPYADSPTDSETVGENVYINIINNAKDYLYINTPYLIIDENILSALKLSAKSGVDVRIVTPHIWDKRFVHFATRSYYYELIESGVQIYEYTKGFMHSKTFVCDDKVATVGTINLDFRSLYLHFECGVWMYKTGAVSQLKKDFLDTLAICHKVTAEKCKGNIFTRFFGEIAQLLAPLM